MSDAAQETEAAPDANAALDEAFQILGGVQGLVAWGLNQPDKFFAAYIAARSRKEVTGEGGGPVLIMLKPL